MDEVFKIDSANGDTWVYREILGDKHSFGWDSVGKFERKATNKDPFAGLDEISNFMDWANANTNGWTGPDGQSFTADEIAARKAQFKAKLQELISR